MTDSAHPDRDAAARKGRRRTGLSAEYCCRSDDLIAADPGIHNGKPIALRRVDAAREHVRPAIVAIQRGGGAVSDGISEGNDSVSGGWSHHVDGIEEIPGRRGERKRSFSFFAALAAGTRAGGKYEVVSAFACQVIGPDSPAT